MIKRIIARLDIKGPNVVKGIHLEGLRVLGRPEDFSQHYYLNGADELFYQDVVASLYERNSLNEVIKKTAKNLFIPLTIGGGIRTIEDIKNALRSGADKVAINTAAIKNPLFIKQAAHKFGSSTIVGVIEAIKQPDGQYFAFTDNGRDYSGLEVVEWAKKMEELGVGEILVTSVDREGTGNGYDVEITEAVANAVGVPVVAHGGAGKASDIKEIITKTPVSAVVLSSMIHYDFITTNRRSIDSELEGNIDFLLSNRQYSKVNAMSIPEIKKYLISEGIDIRKI